MGMWKSPNQVDEVAAEGGDSDMGATDLCPIEAATGELHDWYDDEPWAVALDPARVEAPTGRGKCMAAAQQAVRANVGSLEEKT